MLKHLLIIVFLALLAYFWGRGNNPPIFTKQQLRDYNGVNRPEIYLAILGLVYDVTTGAKHYGPGGTYNYFVGVDSSRGFVSGKLDGEEVHDLSLDDLRALNHWVKFYRGKYVLVGKVVGRYYDDGGGLTEYGKQVYGLIEHAESLRELEELEKRKFPPCNVEWSPEKGSRFWCTNKSGGVVRSWIGEPHKLFLPDEKDYRCVCVTNEHRKQARLEPYKNCDNDSCYD